MTDTQEKILSEFKQKILSAKFDGEIAEVDGNIELKTSYAYGRINFYALEVLIVEMSVTNLADDENKFYLHFELRDLNYAEELFAEMLQTISDLKNQQGVKILLSCTGGLTTGFFADKLNESAQVLGLDFKVDAVPFPKLYEVAFDYSVILLAPQIAYQLKNAQEILHDKLVLKIPPKVFAAYDIPEMLKYIRAELEKWNKTVEERAIAKVRRGIVSDAKILSIALMPTSYHARIAYRIYEKGALTVDETVIKGKLDVVHDVQDILDTISYRHKENFDAVGIATAGAIHDGHLHNIPKFISSDINFQKLLEDKYKVPVTLTNNLKAASLGYYVQQDKFENILFVSRPLGFRASGLGMVLNGKIFDGAHNMAGEIRYIIQTAADHYELEDGENSWAKIKMMDVEQVLDAVCFDIRTAVAVVDPEVICLRSPLTPDLNKIKDKVTEYIPEKYLPEFVYLRDEEMQEFVLLGQMILSLEELERRK